MKQDGRAVFDFVRSRGRDDPCPQPVIGFHATRDEKNRALIKLVAGEFFSLAEGQSGQGQALPPLTALALCLMLLLASCAKRSEVSKADESNKAGESKPTRVLRVCADPNNLPFSNERLEGFENKIAELVAREMNASVSYIWWARRRGFIRNELKTGQCDCVIGVPASSELALTTAPYYRSSYVFVYRKDSHLRIHSFDDPALRHLRIGIQMISDDNAYTPPAYALAERHIAENVRGYMIYGDYSQPNASAQIINAVAAGDIDVAIVWGPLAGFFAKRQTVPLEIVPVSPQVDKPSLPFFYDISMGVRRGDSAFRDELENIIERKRADIEKILDEYGVPRP
ncbi:MAG TPA: substrate-binding domain-containing protein [Blastocatellia bacterium]|nr:substrate-binding domain-containing protein [Blastocatellia bacterium]